MIMYGDNKSGFSPFPIPGTVSFWLNGLMYSWIIQNPRRIMQPISEVLCFCESSPECSFLSTFMDRMVAHAHISKVPSLPAQIPASLYPSDRFSAE